MAKNVFGSDLKVCCEDPVTGFFRNGRCDTSPDDLGMHTVCVEMTEEFLQFSVSRGNDLLHPRPEYGFPGLKPKDKWCICLSRWVEAYKAGMAPRIDLEASHISVLEHVDLDELQKYAL